MESNLSWTSKLSVFSSFDEAVKEVVKGENVRVVHGLDEARLDTLRDSLISEETDTHFFVVGDAIHAMTTANLHTYLAEELEVATPTLAGKPVMLDHSKESTNNIGKVLVTTWEARDGVDSAIRYVARIRKSHDVAEAVRVGDIDTVSIGATANKIECSVCGDDMLECSHHIGKTYENDAGDSVLATAIGRGLKFRELSITPFPADTGASAHVSNSSLYEAVVTLVESSVAKTELHKAGVTDKMSEDNTVELAMAQKYKELQEELERLNKEKDSALIEVASFQKEKKADLVNRVFEMEVNSGIKDSKDEIVRKTQLGAMSIERLEASLETYKNVLSMISKPDTTSKSIISTPTEAVEKVVSDPLVYSSKDIKAAIRRIMGFRTSSSAQETVKKFAMDPSNPNYSDYRMLAAENIEKRGGK